MFYMKTRGFGCCPYTMDEQIKILFTIKADLEVYHSPLVFIKIFGIESLFPKR